MKLWHRPLVAGLAMVALATALAVAMTLVAPVARVSLANGTTIYIDADATGGENNGASWDDAFTDLQDGLTAAVAGTEIWVAEGTYLPSTEHGGSGDRYRSFQLKNGVALYGGFDPDAGATEFEDRDWSSNVTVLSGDLNGDDGPGFVNNEENSLHVFHHPKGTYLDGTAILDGFMITAGNANVSWPHSTGGGMFNYGSSPALTNCIFSGNYGSAGGGIGNVESAPTLNNCTFEGNRAGSGGGMFNADSAPTLSNCAFEGNSADLWGGGITNNYASVPTLTNCTFEGNSAAYEGGGMSNLNTSSPSLTNCTFAGNSAGYGGGMNNAHRSSPTLANCTFSGNSASEGGGMHNDGSSPALADCTFEENSAGVGGGISNVQSSPILADCSFESNTATGDDYGQGGGGMHNDGSSPVLTNCTFTGNSATAGGGIFNHYYSSSTLIDCTFESNTATGDGYAKGGGGMYNDGSSPALTNCTFTGNSAIYGGGMYNLNFSSIFDPTFTSPTLTNCTFSGNSASDDGGGIYNYRDSSPVLVNCILWGDTPDEIVNEDLESITFVTYSDIQGGCGTVAGNSCGPGNIEADPLFVHAGAGDLRLQDTSAAIDAGDNSAAGLDGVAADMSGNPRFFDVPTVPDTGNGDPPLVDMGAYEALPGVIFVDQDAAGANDGRSWSDAFTNLEPALQAAAAGDEIWVAAGVYTPTVEHGGSGDRFRSFQLKNGVAIYGGFDPSIGAIAFESRNWILHETVLSGDIGDEGTGTDNSYHVFYHPGGTNLDSSAILDGFTIADGRAFFFDEYPHWLGGGMYNNGSSPALSNVTFTGNWAEDGGGLYNDDASSPTLTNCSFEDNSASYGGGMLNIDSSSPTLTNCSFERNTANSRAGGMYNIIRSSPALINCTFSGNSAIYGGGMLNTVSSSPTLTNCRFFGNSANEGGGMTNYSSSPMLTNCTFWGNSAEQGGGIYNYNDSSPELTNSILWGDTADEMFNNLSSPVVSYSDIQGGCEAIPENVCGTGNIDADPLFVDAANGDFHLGPGSPCIDVGSNAAPNLPDHDFEGDDRVLDGNGDGVPVVDMGVDEMLLRVYLPLVLKGY